MNLYDFPPVAALIQAADWLVTNVTTLLTPLAGVNSAAVAVIVLTLLVRAALIPVGRSQVRAGIVRQRLAPRIAALQRRHRKDPERLARELSELYATERTTPFAGLGPALAQMPVLVAVYGLFVTPMIGGHANLLLDHTLFGIPLGTTFAALLGSGAATPATTAVFVTIMAVIAVVAQVSRRLLAVAPPTTDTPGVVRALGFLPFLTAAVAGVVPLAAALYLAASTTWTFVERLVLNHLYGVGSPGAD